MPDSDFQKSDRLKKHNLEVAVEDGAQAERAVKEIRSSGIDGEITVDTEEDKRASLRGDMRDELEGTVAGPGNVGPQTKAQTKEIVRWIAIATPAGALLGLLIAWIFWPSVTGFIATAAVCAVAGATAGFVGGGAIGPVKHEEGGTEAEVKPVVGVHSDRPEDIAKAERVLDDVEAARVDRVDPMGRPHASSKDTRPVRGDTPT